MREVKKHTPVNSLKQSQSSSIKVTTAVALTADVLAVSKMKLLPDMTPDQSSDVNVSTGLRDFTCEQYLLSLKRLNKAITHHPKSITPRFVRGLCHEKLCEYELALKDFTVCCELGTEKQQHECALAYFNRGVLNIRLEKFDLAMDCFTAAISLYDMDPDFHSNRALLYRRKGDFQRSQDEYQSVRRLTYQNNNNNSNGGNKSDSTRLSIGKVHSKSPPFNGTDNGINKISDENEAKTIFFGQLHTALICPAKDRTPSQIDILVKETKMMEAFVHFDTDQQKTLWKHLEYKKLSSNVRIFEQGDSSDGYYVIWSGAVSARVLKEGTTHQTNSVTTTTPSRTIQRHSDTTTNVKVNDNVAKAHLAMMDGAEVVVNVMKSGETLGEAVLQGDVRKASCVTEQPTELLCIQKEHFDLIFRAFLERVQEEKMNFLSQLQCFRNLTPDRLNFLANFAREHKFNAGETIIRQDSPADGVYFLKSGLVSVNRRLRFCDSMRNVALTSSSSSSGNQTPKHEQHMSDVNVCVTRLSSGDIFGEASVSRMDGEKKLFPSSVVSETKVVCYRLDKVHIDDSNCGRDGSTIATLISMMAIKCPSNEILYQAHLNKKRNIANRKRIMKSNI